MSMRRPSFVSLFAVVVACLAFLSRSHGLDVGLKPPATVAKLDLDNYVGTWKQVYASWTVLKTFEKDGYCIKAEYTLGKNDTITVNNTQHVGSPAGNVSRANGYAYVPDSSEPGKLKVHFEDPAVPMDGDYWVLLLGPVENKKYQWSVVSDPLRLSLFVLVRDPADFADRFEEGVLEHLKALGFVFPWNKPRATPWDDCTDSGSSVPKLSSSNNADAIAAVSGATVPGLRGAVFLGDSGFRAEPPAAALSSRAVSEAGEDAAAAPFALWGPAHASCKGVIWTFPEDSCADVEEALRSAAQDMGGLDGCANGGERCGYSVADSSTVARLVVTHETPKAHYMDDMKIEFEAGAAFGNHFHSWGIGGGDCRAKAESVSRTWYAVLDQSTNYCNLRNLVDATGLTYTESGVSDKTCTQYSSANCDVY